MSFEEQFKKTKIILRGNTLLKKKEFDMLYQSLMDELQSKFPMEYAEFWKNIDSPKMDVRYTLRKVLR